MMRTKLQNSMAELFKLKNQIRLELNKIRPSREMVHFENNRPSIKKVYNQKSKTNIIEPRDEKSLDAKKRHYNVDCIAHLDTSKHIERKHFQKSYGDKVSIQNGDRRRKSSYLQIRPSSSSKNQTNLSLADIGKNDRSMRAASKSGKKITPSMHTFTKQFF